MNTATYNKDFHWRAKKAEIPTCNILGVDIAAIDMEWLLAYLNNNIKALAGDYICVSNVHTTVTAYEEEAYRKVQNGGIMAIPDGGPLSSVGQGSVDIKTWNELPGPSLMGEIFENLSGRKDTGIILMDQYRGNTRNIFTQKLNGDIIREFRLQECIVRHFDQ